MEADAQSRARKFINERRGARFAVQALGIIDSFIVLKILSILGLLAAVIISSGEARFPTNSVSELSDWAISASTGFDGADTLFDDSGLLPVVTGNLKSGNPLHRVTATSLSFALKLVPTLRNNLGALTTLLAVFLLLLLIQNVFDQYRRGLLADLSTDAASALRRQIHRQMYRLGQSSLPTEGTGPVINLATREVNDVRDGLYDELDRGLRTPVPFAGPGDLSGVVEHFNVVHRPRLAEIRRRSGGHRGSRRRDQSRHAPRRSRNAPHRACLRHGAG